MKNELATVLNKALELATSSPTEESSLSEAAAFIKDRINTCLRKKKLNAELSIGGSVAKGTWLPGATDIDCFLQFDYNAYKSRKDLSDVTEKVLKTAFQKVNRLHGSRDYFQIKHKKYLFEIVPVLRIKKPSEARNVTDVSQLHVDFVLKHRKLASDIRLAKQFCKGCGVYGAESYICGFSGHVIEVLTIFYHGFTEFLSMAANWKNETLIDSVSHYIGRKKNPLEYINPSKTEGPLVVVDPVQPERNAAAAVSKEKYELFKEKCKEFLKLPSVDFFVPKVVTVSELTKKKDGRKLVVLSVKVPSGKRDVVGAKLLKQFEFISKHLGLTGFTILEKGWQWKDDCTYWFYFDPALLSPLIRHIGPQASEKERLASFRAKHGKKVKIVNGISYVDLKREFRTPKDFLESLKLKDVKITY